MDTASTGMAWTLRQQEWRGHCGNRNGVVIASTGMAWSLRQQEWRGHCFNRNGVDTASTGTAWTLRQPERRGHCGNRNGVVIAPDLFIFQMSYLSLANRCRLAVGFVGVSLKISRVNWRNKQSGQAISPNCSVGCPKTHGTKFPASYSRENPR